MIDKAELPNLRAQVEELGEQILNYKTEDENYRKGSSFNGVMERFQKFRALSTGYDDYRLAVAKWNTLGCGVPPPGEEVVDLGGLYAYSDGVVGPVKEVGALFGRKQKVFGQAGTFTIRGQAGA